MSTVTSRDQALREGLPADVKKQGITPPAKNSGFGVSRLVAWYRTAVLDPTTEAEDAEWQKFSF